MSQPTPDRFAELRAPATWQAVEFISDLHLHAEEPATHRAWLQYLGRPLSERPSALFILGDLFEVWVGDDILSASAPIENTFWCSCVSALHAYSQATPVFFMVGNRDFLVGQQATQACGMQPLSDPTVLDFHGQRWLLSHGDALCLADTDYMRFRQQVRHPDWQREFLARPLVQRMAIARELREQSEARKHRVGHDASQWADVDTDAAIHWLQSAGAHSLIHGHTHRPADHALGQGLNRVVLSDWDLAASPPRGEVMRLNEQGLQRLPFQNR
jgi:UDP-2,3-diacylglucosamine hydrolase